MYQRIAVIGSCNVDLVTTAARIPAAGETLAASGFAIFQGGKGANQAVAVARLGGDVLLIGRVGADLFGTGMLDHLRAMGVDTRHLRAVPGAQTGVASILVEPSGENRILIAEGANGLLGPADLEAAAADLAGCGLILLQLEVPLETIYHAIDFGARQGIPVLLNPAPAMPGLDLARILPVAFLVPNQTELALLTGRPTGTVAEAEAAARALVGQGIGTVIVTLGAEGALLVGAGPSVHVPAIPALPRDTTGAGDAFIGAFARYYVRSGRVEAAMRVAVRYAADSITKAGAQPSFADAAEFARFCEGLP